MEITIGVVILCGNEEDVVGAAVKSAKWSNELILIATNSTDKSIDIVKKNYPSAKIIKNFGGTFSDWRNLGLKNLTSDWILYLDADEVITKNFLVELRQKLASKLEFTHYAIPRNNYFLGNRVRFGNTYPDYQKRLFRTNSITEWQGVLHEYPVVSGNMGYFNNPILHNTHRKLFNMVGKTNTWTDLQANSLFLAKHPPMATWRIFRMFFTKFFEKYILQKMYKDHVVGLITSLFESFDIALIYSKLWEKQRHANN